MSGSGMTARELVGRSIWVGPFRIGIVDDVVLGADLAVVLGVIIETTAGRHCFLPWVATRAQPDGSMECTSTAMLLAETELDHYLRSGTRLSRVVGVKLADVRGGDAIVGDVVIGRGGQIEGFVVSGGEQTRSVALADTRVRWSDGELLELSIGEPDHAGPECPVRSAVQLVSKPAAGNVSRGLVRTLCGNTSRASSNEPLSPSRSG
jgi:hypothetical protein